MGEYLTSREGALRTVQERENGSGEMRETEELVLLCPSAIKSTLALLWVQCDKRPPHWSKLAVVGWFPPLKGIV